MASNINRAGYLARNASPALFQNPCRIAVCKSLILCARLGAFKAFQKEMIMGQTTTAKNATKFKAELWTTAGKSEIWATVMVDGSDAGSPCAFGPREKME